MFVFCIAHFSSDSRVFGEVFSPVALGVSLLRRSLLVRARFPLGSSARALFSLPAAVLF